MVLARRTGITLPGAIREEVPPGCPGFPDCAVPGFCWPCSAAFCAVEIPHSAAAARIPVKSALISLSSFPIQSHDEAVSAMIICLDEIPGTRVAVEKKIDDVKITDDQKKRFRLLA
jgi:hypothetical protein